MISALLSLPSDILAAQLRACSGEDLAALAASARLPTPPPPSLGLTLTDWVARSALIHILDDDDKTNSQSWLQIFQFLCCSKIQCGVQSYLIGHHCSGNPAFVRCGVCTCKLFGEDSESHVAFVTPVVAWKSRPGHAGLQGCKPMPLPRKLTIRIDTFLDAVAPVTQPGQVLAMVPGSWGGSFHDVRPESTQLNSTGALLQVIRELNRRGECSTIRIRQLMLHVMTLAQACVVARSSFQRVLSDAILGFAGLGDSCLLALSYTKADSGFYFG